MIRRAHLLITVLILLLGAVHTWMGGYCKEFDENALWFIGSGIAIILAGLFNLLLILDGTKTARTFALIVNSMVVGLFIIAAQVLQGPQVYIGIILFLLAGILCFLVKVKPSARP